MRSLWLLAPILCVTHVLVACSSVGGVSIPTGMTSYAPTGKAVRILVRGEQPRGAEIGLVEVHGSADEATIDSLFPLFVERAARLGADAVLLDDIVSESRLLTGYQYDRVTYTCPYRGVCTGTQSYPIANEVLYLSLRGRAYRDSEAAPRPLPPSDSVSQPAPLNDVSPPAVPSATPGSL